MSTTARPAPPPPRPSAANEGPSKEAKPDRIALEQSIDATIRRETLQWKAADTGEELTLSITHVRKLFANPTKSGKLPSDRDCWLFLQLCKARGLNPYVGDAFLVGYDEGESAKFSLITAHQALLKRAEASGLKKGMESGVIVRDAETKKIVETAGDFVDDRDTLLGGWCKVYRRDYDMPIYDRVKLSTYNKGYSRWRADPAGMITKVAEASAHRLAFPSETGGMYVREEADAIQDANDIAAIKQPVKSRADRMADELAERQAKQEEESVSQLPDREPEDISQEPEKPAAQPQVARGPACLDEWDVVRKFVDAYGIEHVDLVKAECGYGNIPLAECHARQLKEIIDQLTEMEIGGEVPVKPAKASTGKQKEF